MIQLFVTLLVVAAISAWWQLMQGRQKARKAAGTVCADHGLQLLDDTVSLSSITWDRSGRRSSFLVNYRFEFATDGARRRSGLVKIAWPDKLSVSLDLEEGQLIETLTRTTER